MKPNHARPKTGGFTGWDLAIVLATLALVCVIFLPALAKSRAKASRINCISQLKQIGLAFRVWSNTSSEKFPWVDSTNWGGTLEFVGDGNPLPHFLAMSNELSAPKALVCPSQTVIKKVSSWSELTNRSQLSYFIGSDAEETRPTSILSGDRSISTNGQFHSGLVAVSTNAPLNWAGGIHPPGLGNIAFGDGSAQQVTNGASLFQRAAHTNPVIRLVIP